VIRVGGPRHPNHLLRANPENEFGYPESVFLQLQGKMWVIVSLKQDQERLQTRQLTGQVHTLQNQLMEARARAKTDSLTGISNRQAWTNFW